MISVIILTKDNQKTLRRTLESTRAFPEVLVCDTGSRDKTLEIAKEFANVKLLKKTLSGFGSLRNEVSKEASHDWILSLDSDEVLSASLQKELKALSLDPGSVYDFSFHNYYNQRLIKWCGWYPESHVRLYHRKNTQFSDAHVHEGVLAGDLKLKRCKGVIEHYSYQSTHDFLEKMQRYSDLFAKQHQGKKKSSLCHAIYHGSFAFFKSYMLKRGFMGGKEGFVISVYNANTAFYKYLKLAEANQKCS